MADVQAVVYDTVRSLIERRSKDPVEITSESDFFEDLGMDSLEVAELSAVLEETFGTDPYTAGKLARTPQEIFQFYAALPG